MSDNTALVLIVCVMSITIGAAVIAGIRGAVEIIRVLRGREPDPKTGLPLR